GGAAEREVRIATRPIPDYGTPARTLHVAPATKDQKGDAGDGSKEKPFRGIAEAEKSARPGDLLLLHAGDYGSATFERSGQRAVDGVGAQPKYIVWKAAGDGPVSFERAYVMASAVWFEGLAFERKSDRLGLRAGKNETTEVVVRANTFRGF